MGIKGPQIRQKSNYAQWHIKTTKIDIGSIQPGKELAFIVR